MLLILQSCEETVIFFHVRHVAQPGSARSWGVRGRRFKSSRADQITSKKGIILPDNPFFISQYSRLPATVESTTHR